MTLTWIKCPFCNEIADLKRVGKPLTIYRKANGKLGTKISKRVRCGFCGKTFTADGPTVMEAFGRDGEDDTAF